jgi:pimeloyl-ACP methyl ester carboxylesterase
VAHVLVCLHGLGRSPSDWNGVRGSLAELGEVVTPELPRDVKRAQRIAAASTPDGAIVVGHSLGAIIALVMAAERGTAIRGVVASSPFFPPALNGRSVPAALSDYLSHRVAFLRERRGNQVVAPRTGGVRGLGYLVRTAAHRSEFRAKTAAVTSAVLIVHAADDHYVPLDFVLAAVGAHPAWQSVVLSAGGHYPHVSDPAEWLAAVDPWLRRLTGRTGGGIHQVGDESDS